jgi:cytosine/adenosine deaminase-related metal-dependent hydrolase
VGPGGWKQRHLEGAPAEAVAAGIRGYVGEMAVVGTAAFLDFREGGVAGVRLLRELAGELDARPVILGRPARHDFREEEADELLAVADGVGLSARRDFPDPADADAWLEAAHRRRRLAALHVSEARHEELDPILALEPDWLVHGTQATRQDMARLAEEGVPVVVCPRSNAYAGLRTPMRTLREAGVTVAVGTDNGMLQDGNLLAELALLRRLDPGLGLEEALRLATWNGRELARLPAAWPPRKGAPLDLVVLPENPLPAVPDRRPGFTGGVA